MVKKICFPINEHGWILLFEVLGKKTIICSETIRQPKNKKRKSDRTNQHRMVQLECEGGVKVKSKYYDISSFNKFIIEEK